MFAYTATPPATAPNYSAICHGLQAELADHLDEASNQLVAQAKEIIFMEGDTSDHIYEVVEGVVLLSKMTMGGRRQITGFVYPGEHFGFGTKEQNGYTAEAVTRARLRRYPRQMLDQSMTLYPALSRRFLDLARDELAAAQEQMLLLGCKSAIEKFASFLLHLSERYAAQGEDSMRLFIPMMRADIADYLGLSTETVCRTINRLKQLGIIEVQERCYIKVRNFDRLVDFAEDEDCFC